MSSSSSEIFQCDETKLYKNLLPGMTWIKRYEVPSMEKFYTDIFVPKVPAVLESND